MHTKERQAIKTLTASIAYWQSLKSCGMDGLNSIMDRRIGRARRAIRAIEKKLTAQNLGPAKFEGIDNGDDPSTRGMAVYSGVIL